MQYQGDFSSLALVPVLPERPVHILIEPVCVCVMTVWENAGRIGRRLLWQDRLEARRQRPITLAAAPIKELFDFVWSG